MPRARDRRSRPPNRTWPRWSVSRASTNGYVELDRNRECAAFQYAADKGSDDVVAELRPFRATLTADPDHRFNAVYASGNVIEVGCNGGCRKCRDGEQTQPVLAAAGGPFIGAICAEEGRAHELGLTGDALLAHRRDRIRPIASDFNDGSPPCDQRGCLRSC